MGDSRKGGQFERKLAVQLSLWWTDGERDDVFWRTSGSGARATTRSKKGKKTHGQSGDLQAVDPVGAPLTRLLSIELKRGYKDAHLGDLIDVGPAQTKPRPLEEFISQAEREAREADLPFWLLIIRRDSRQAMVFMTWDLYENLKDAGSSLHKSLTWLKVRAPIRHRVDGARGYTLAVTTLHSFLLRVKPEHIRFLDEEWNG
jgi:hypothetical protein